MIKIKNKNGLKQKHSVGYSTQKPMQINLNVGTAVGASVTKHEGNESPRGSTMIPSLTLLSSGKDHSYFYPWSLVGVKLETHKKMYNNLVSPNNQG